MGEIRIVGTGETWISLSDVQDKGILLRFLILGQTDM